VIGRSGGGSGYVTGTSTTLTTGSDGSGVVSNPPNTGDGDYVAGKGRGNLNAAGGTGYVVIAY
jgi:hypothetical protein